jgi:tetratricopeptide (TPR) repeat protein
LGVVAQEQRSWLEAEDFYKKALAFRVEFNDRHSQGSTYHNLGMVAQEQRRWPEAADLHLKALALFAEFQDQHNVARALRHLARLKQASSDESLTGRVADVLGVSAEGAANLLGEAAGDTREATPRHE